MKRFSYIFTFILLLLCTACEKFLDEKPIKSYVIPSSLKDCQAIFDYWNVMNNNDAVAGEISADNFYLTASTYASLSPEEYKRMYIWEKDYIFPEIVNDWATLYETVYHANTVLEVLAKIKKDGNNETEWNNLKGQALVFRSESFLQAAWQWAPTYDAATAATDLGVPLRLSSDFNQPTVRATVQQTYDHIIAELKEAVSLLPASQVHVLRPSKMAAYALLARTYLSMRQYNKAGLYADSCLQLKNTLLDYNSFNPTAAYPFSPFNEEVLFESVSNTLGPLSYTRAKIDSLLYGSYEANDLRKVLFFKSNGDGTYAFKGTYEGNGPLFSGPTTAEMLLIRAECAARAGNTAAAMDDLNTLLSKRWKAGTFVPFTAADATQALEIILRERRKELVMRLLRWMDIKRLNIEGAGITIKRVINGQTYTLSPGDPHYALPIPESVISLSGIPQNPR